MKKKTEKDERNFFVYKLSRYSETGISRKYPLLERRHFFFILSWGRAANVVYFIPYSTYSFSRVPFLQNLLFLFVLFPKHACTYVFFHHDNKLVFIFLDLTMSTVLLKRCKVSLGYCMYIKKIGNKNIFYFLFCVFSFVFGKGGVINRKGA